MATPQDDTDLQIPALGQPWALGCMYDATQGKLVLGHKLWDDKVIKKHKQRQIMRGEATEAVTEDTIDQRSDKFNLDVGMKLGFLGGLVKVNGSAKYLDERSSDAHTARVNFYYKAKTHAETLPMEILNDLAIQYSEALDRGNATHVCVGVEYGGNAVFEFEREISHEEVQREVRGNLSVIIDNIPTIKIEGHGKVEIDEQTKKNTDKLRTKYVGDIHLNAIPTNFESAVKAFHELHGNLKEETAVPVMVHLMPLTRIKPNAARLAKELQEETLNDLTDLLVGLKLGEEKLSVMRQSPGCTLYPDFGKALSVALSFVKSAHSKLRTAVQECLPKIRRGDEQQLTVLSSMLDWFFLSPFEPVLLGTWIERKEMTLDFIDSFYRNMGSCLEVCKTKADLLQVETDRTVEHALVFKLQLGDEVNDAHLRELRKGHEHFLKPSSNPNLLGGNFGELALSREFIVLQREFLDFMEAANEDPTSPKFVLAADTKAAKNLPAGTLTASITYMSKPSSGLGNVEDYRPAAIPGDTKVSQITDKSFVVTWKTPAQSKFIERYEVQYRKQAILDWTDETGDENPAVDGHFVANLIGSRIQIVAAMGSDQTTMYGKVIELDSSTNKFIVQLEGGKKVKVKRNQMCPDLREHPWDSLIVPADFSAVAIDDLTASETYEVRIRAICAAGGSAFRSLVHPVKTACERDSELTYLVLGPTGVGKSTFITSFRNYLSYESLEAAKEGGLLPVMPTKFTCVDRTNKEHKVEVEGMASEMDEEFSAVENLKGVDNGEAVTQKCCSYVFSLPRSEDVKVRIIDTPGIGDPRGPAQDEKNCQHIFDFVGKYPKLHGILVLLKPNDARLTTTFKYCIMELLKYLHLSASRNIFFVMTNSRSTMYTMGDTVVPLRALLQEVRNNPPYVNIELNLDGPQRTVFCLDSESFRFLAARAQGISLPATVTESSFSDSWNVSADCCRELLGKARRIKPHMTQETTSLNEARRQALALREPMVQIMTVIEQNIEAMEYRRQDIMKANANIDDLKKHLRVEKQIVEAKPLDHPSTVCTHQDCVEIEQDKFGNNVQKFVKACHKNCGIRTEVDKFPNPELQCCWAMRGKHQCSCNATCFDCGHSWEFHMHTRVEYTPKTVQLVNSAVERELSQKMDAKAAKEKLLRATATLKEEYEAEQKELRQACNVFGCFLARNGISPVNKAFERYIRCEITRLERLQHKLDLANGDHDDITPKIEGLKNQLKLHQEETKEIMALMESGAAVCGNKVIDAKTVSKLRLDLFQLKHFGGQIKALSEAFDAGTANMSVKERYVPPPQSNAMRNRRRGRHQQAPHHRNDGGNLLVYDAKKKEPTWMDPRTWF